MKYNELKTIITTFRSDTTMPILFIPIGVPGCGKSTLCEKLNADFGAIRISSDDIRKEILGNENDQTQNARVFEEFYNRLSKGLVKGNCMIGDATNITKKTRMPYFEHTKDMRDKCLIVGIQFTTPYHIVVKNDAKRERTVGVNVINRYYSQYGEPHINEGFDVILNYSEQTDEFTENDISIVKEYINEKDSTNVIKVLDLPYTIGAQKDLEQTSKYHQENLTEHIIRIVSPMFFEESIHNSKINVLYDVFPKFKDYVLSHQKQLAVMVIFHDIGKPMCRKTKEMNLRGQGWEMTSPGKFIKKSGKEKEVPNYKDYQFIGHELVSARIMKFEYLELFESLGFDEQEVYLMIASIEKHLLPNELFKDGGENYSVLDGINDEVVKLMLTFYIFDNNGKVSKYEASEDDKRNENIVKYVFSR